LLDQFLIYALNIWMQAPINITQIALVVLTSLGFGLFFERIRQPAVLGYIIAGVLLSSFNLISNREMVSALAELGVIMLLYLVGLELSLRSFQKIWLTSLGVTLAQIAMSLCVVIGLGTLFHMEFGLSLLLACAIALSSTAVAIKMLESIGELRTETGRLTIGVLVAQDIIVVPMILIIRGMGTNGLNWMIFLKVGVSLAILTALVWYLSRKEKISIPLSHLFAGHEDLQPLAGLFFCFGMAAITGLIDLSAAYGAFLGGLIVGNSTDRQSMLHAMKPIQAILMMVFFLSVGLLLDYKFIWQNFWKVMVLLFFITIGKTIFNIFILHILRQPWPRAFLASLVLSQMGEFAFLLTTVGLDAKFITPDGAQLAISLAALSLALSPFWLMAARRLHDYAPTGVKTLSQLINTVYKPKMQVIEGVSKQCKKLAHRLHLKDKDKADPHA
jgi:CPA2 family monovalent cation:H+ antiporter-2